MRTISFPLTIAMICLQGCAAGTGRHLRGGRGGAIGGKINTGFGSYTGTEKLGEGVGYSSYYDNN